MQTVTTNASGQYQFTNIIEGNYYVTVKLPADYITTVANTADANSNSDFAANSNGSEVFFRHMAATVPIWILGWSKTQNRRFLWEDRNYNGSQDSGEPGIAGVAVKLYNNAGNLITQTTTDASGKYAFDNLPASIYELEFAVAQTYQATKYQQGSAATDSDVKDNKRTGLLNFQNTTSQTGVDAGFTDMLRWATLFGTIKP